MASMAVASPTSLVTFVPLSTTTVATPATSASASTPLPTTSEEDDTAPYPPLTTPWSKPEVCTWTYDAYQELRSDMAGPIAWLDMEPIPDATTLSCYPPGMFEEDHTGIFSPASCPSGWTTVTVQQNTDEPKHQATTTAVCCSSEYYLDGDHCYREVPTVLAVPISYNTSASTHDVYAEETSVLVSATLAVHAIQALFQEHDKEVLGLTYEEEIRDELVTPTGLSTSAKIGIGVGSAIAGLLVIGLGVWLFLRKGTKKRSNRHLPHEMQAVHGPVTHDAENGTSIIQHPPPAYGGTSARRNSLDDDDDGDNESVDSAQFDGEIEVLKAQKAAIQRRIEELEKVDDNHDVAQK